MRDLRYSIVFRKYWCNEIVYMCTFFRLLAEQIVFCRSIIHFCSAVFQFFVTFMLYKLVPIMFIL